MTGFLPPPSTQEVQRYRDCISTCTCPICGAGPYKSLSMHTNKAHSVDRHELRRRAEIPGSRSITSPELAAEARERAIERDSIRSTAAYVEAIKGRKVTKRFPAYSRKVIAENHKKLVASMTPEELSDYMRGLSVNQSEETRKRQGRSLSASKRRKRSADQQPSTRRTL